MEIKNSHKFVWSGGIKYKILPGSVNEAGRYVNVFSGDYASFGSPDSTKCLSFDEIENAE